MQEINSFIFNYAEYAHWTIFFLLILAGFNIPISEDVLLIVGGIIAQTLPFDRAIVLYLWLFFGCYLSAWIAFGLGRYFGTRVFKLSKKRSSFVKHFYLKYGFLTLFFGRFIPFGARNIIFMTAGMSRISFSRFFLQDIPGCLISSCLLFSLGYSMAEHADTLYITLHIYKKILGSLLFILFIAMILIRLYRRKTKVCYD